MFKRKWNKWNCKNFSLLSNFGCFAWTFNLVSIILDDMAKNEKNRKNSTGLAFACWILGFLILLIVFLVKQDDIYSNLKTTRFFERLFGSTPEFIQKHEVKEKKAPEIETVIELKTEKKQNSQENLGREVLPLVEKIDENKSADESVSEQKKENSGAEIKKTEKTEEKPQDVKNEEKIEKSAETSPANIKKEEKPKVPEKKTITVTNQKIYFVYIGEDGTLSRKMITRPVEKNDSPLVTNMNILLAGPNAQESGRGYRSLIPEGTRLLSASVRDGVAYLNFNEQFEFNTVGMDGYQAQLMQIVYTATEFGTVNSVQFLIEGQKKEYLGSEGIWIGSPLSRSSFN